MMGRLRTHGAAPAAALLLALSCAPALAAKSDVLSGIDVLEEHGFRELQGKRVGLITNQTGVDRKGRPSARILANASGVRLSALFSPEHGFTGTSDENEIASGTYALPDGGSIPLYSLYGATKAPTPEMLRGLDALVFDIQDIGTRFYTYSATMGMAMEAAAKAGMEFIVLDRPDPVNGEIVEGPILDDDIRHLTAYFPVPVRHGMTMGELARLHNVLGRVGAQLQVVALKGWSRGMWADRTGLPWVRPSPNMPDLDAAALYPGIGCFEASNVSVGRGTKLPFRWIGAPWLDPKPVLKRLKAARLPGIDFSAHSFTPAKSVHQGKKCRGIRIRLKDRDAARPLAVFAHLVTALRDLYPKQFDIRDAEMARMTGTRRFVELYRSGAGPEKLVELFDKDSSRFKTERAPFLLY